MADLFPPPATYFTVLTAGSLNGDFDNAANGGFVDEVHGQGDFRVRYDAVPNAVVLTNYQTVPFLAGDFSGDGVVDAADYTVWRDNVGGAAGTLINDPNLTDIGPDQYATWRANYGESLTGVGAASSAEVPEPNAVVLFGSLVLLSLGFMRHKAASALGQDRDRLRASADPAPGPGAARVLDAVVRPLVVDPLERHHAEPFVGNRRVEFLTAIVFLWVLAAEDDARVKVAVVDAIGRVGDTWPLAWPIRARARRPARVHRTR